MNDKEGRKWLLQKLYESKYRYIFRADNHKLYVTISKPVSVDGVHYKQADCGLTMRLMSAICPLFDDIRGFISISEELGVIDWSKVAVDTPILVDKAENAVVKRHFEKFENGRVYFYDNGRTSWSFNGTTSIEPKYVKLAGGSDEN
jgi:hypothetical protein